MDQISGSSIRPYKSQSHCITSACQFGLTIAEKAVAANAHTDADIYHTISKDLICLQIVDIYKISGVVILLPYYIS